MKASTPNGVYFTQECYLQKVARVIVVWSRVFIFYPGVIPRFLPGIKSDYGMESRFLFLMDGFSEISRQKGRQGIFINEKYFSLNPKIYASKPKLRSRGSSLKPPTSYSISSIRGRESCLPAIGSTLNPAILSPKFNRGSSLPRAPILHNSDFSTQASRLSTSTRICPRTMLSVSRPSTKCNARNI